MCTNTKDRIHIASRLRLKQNTFYGKYFERIQQQLLLDLQKMLAKILVLYKNTHIMFILNQTSDPCPSFKSIALYLLASTLNGGARFLPPLVGHRCGSGWPSDGVVVELVGVVVGGLYVVVGGGERVFVQCICSIQKSTFISIVRVGRVHCCVMCKNAYCAGRLYSWKVVVSKS